MMVSDLFQRLRNSPYWKNIGLLSSAQGLSMLVPIVAAPIMGRIYEPAEYAFLALYMGFASILSASSTLQMHQGIIAEKQDENVPPLISLIFIIGLGATAVSLLFALVIWKQFINGSDFAEFGPWLLMLPFSTAGNIIASITINFAHRRDKYKIIALVNFLMIILTTSLSIIFGIIGLSTYGLLYSYLITQVVMVAALIAYGYHIGAFAQLNFNAQSFRLFKRHKNFAFFTFPSEFINILSANLPLYALSYIGAIIPLGAFNRAVYLSSVPLKLIGLAVAPVFRRRVRDDLTSDGSCRRIYIQTFIFLSVIAFPFSIFVYAYGPAIFAIVLGEDWRVAGEIASIVAPMACVQMIAAPLSAVYQINEGQKAYFIYIALALFVSLSATVYAVSEEFSYQSIILIYSLCYTVLHIFIVIDGYRNQTVEKAD